MTTTDLPELEPGAADAPPTPPVPHAPQVPGPPSPDMTIRKSPGAAAALSLVGLALGHLYLGLYRRALMLFGGAALSIYLELPPLAVFIYFFMIIDAYRQAQIINAHGVEGVTPSAARDVGALGMGVFLIVVGAVLLLDIHDILDFYWLRDWWPAVLVLIGLYLIGDAIRSRGGKKTESNPYATEGGGPTEFDDE